MSNFDNLINICGAGRNVGKTYLCEAIIAHCSDYNTLIALKISTFKHHAKDKIGLHKLIETKFYTIWQELNFTPKDSGRYLKAGAKASYYVECDDAHLLNAFLFIYKMYGNSCLIVCESASITKHIKPAVSVFVESAFYATEENKLQCLNRSTIVLKERSIEISMPQLYLCAQNSNWTVKYAQKTICGA
ncbi:MAG: hypothetical protein PHW92_09365 [Lutibacter sp.]|nr:hypothetical protein [Lutibacter sp.]